MVDNGQLRLADVQFACGAPESEAFRNPEFFLAGFRVERRPALWGDLSRKTGVGDIRIPDRRPREQGVSAPDGGWRGLAELKNFPIAGGPRDARLAWSVSDQPEAMLGVRNGEPWQWRQLPPELAATLAATSRRYFDDMGNAWAQHRFRYRVSDVVAQAAVHPNTSGSFQNLLPDQPPRSSSGLTAMDHTAAPPPDDWLHVLNERMEAPPARTQHAGTRLPYQDPGHLRTLRGIAVARAARVVVPGVFAGLASTAAALAALAFTRDAAFAGTVFAGGAAAAGHGAHAIRAVTKDLVPGLRQQLRAFPVQPPGSTNGSRAR